MGQRITLADVRSALRRYAAITGRRVAQAYNDVEALDLDSAYGGHSVRLIESEHGAQSDPFGLGFSSKSALWDKLQAAISAVYDYQKSPAFEADALMKVVQGIPSDSDRVDFLRAYWAHCALGSRPPMTHQMIWEFRKWAKIDEGVDFDVSAGPRTFHFSYVVPENSKYTILRVTCDDRSWDLE